METTNEIRSVMEISGAMYWKVEAMSEIISWVSMMKGTVVQSSINEKYNEARNLNETRWRGNRCNDKIPWK